VINLFHLDRGISGLVWFIMCCSLCIGCSLGSFCICKYSEIYSVPAHC